jgi:alcohol dehydrogenase class IV
MKNFEFTTVTRIIFGAGSLSKVGAIAKTFGTKALVVGGSSPERFIPLLKNLEGDNLPYVTFSVSGEPSIEIVLEGLSKARSWACDMVISMGGGSVIDAGKAIAALLTNPGEALDYLEVVGKGQPLLKQAAPFIAIPTTSGTGSEVTQNAVLSVPEKQVKVSMRSPLMLPRVALIDPELTYGLPKHITAYTGMDALTQCLEPFVSRAANPMTDNFCREGLKRAALSLRVAYETPKSANARADMSLASLMGGLALTNAKLGATHGLAGPLGGMINAPHGALCARLLPFVVETNLTALQERQPSSEALRRYNEVAQIFLGLPTPSKYMVIWLKQLCQDLEIPSLSQLGLTEAHIPEAVSKAQNTSSMKGNPVMLSDDELSGVLRRAL